MTLATESTGLLFRADKSANNGGQEMTLAFDGPSIESFEGGAVDAAVYAKAAEYGMSNCGMAGPPTVFPVDPNTDDGLQTIGPGVEVKCYRALFRLMRKL